MFLLSAGSTIPPAPENECRAVSDVAKRLKTQDQYKTPRRFLADGDDAMERLNELKGSGPASLALALSCVVAIAVDLHIRGNSIVSDQLGLWIANYAEPRFIDEIDPLTIAELYRIDGYAGDDNPY